MDLRGFTLKAISPCVFEHPCDKMFIYIIEWVVFVYNWNPFHPKPAHFKAYLGAFVPFYIH